MLADFRDHQGAVSALVRASWRSPPRCSPRSRSASGASPRRGPCGSPCRSGSPRPSCRSSACCAGRSSCPATRPTRRAPTPASRPPPATRSRTASDILGTAIGETLGYLLTATWTVLVIVALGRRYAGRWFQVLGAVSAALVLVGVLSPLGLPVDRHRELLRLRPLERVADRLRGRDPGPRAARRQRAGRDVSPRRGDVMTPRRRQAAARCAGSPRSSASRSAASLAELVAGPVDGLGRGARSAAPSPALVLGAVQAWALGSERPAGPRVDRPRPRWA